MTKINHMVCPACGHDFYVDTAYAQCDACGRSFYATESRTCQLAHQTVLTSGPVTVGPPLPASPVLPWIGNLWGT